MHIVIAPQSLKGSLTASAAGQAIAQGAQAVFPEAHIDIVPVADGGEGTMQSLVDATGGRFLYQTVTGPRGDPVSASFGILGDGHTAVIEMTTCAGLPLVPQEQRDPRFTTTYGVGELIRVALDYGCQRFIIGIGGSATNDGGAGMAQALGVKLRNHTGNELTRGGAALADLATIALDEIDPRLKTCSFEVACDVTNPLCGPQGASAVYGPQKGATPAMVAELDTALANYARVIARDLGIAVADVAGAGAAGGMGAGLLAFLHARLRPGAQIVLAAVRLEDYMQTADLVITAEGQLDEQTRYGKSVSAVASMAKQYGIPVLVLAGSLGKDYHSLYHLGVDAITSIVPGPMSLATAMQHAAKLTRQATERALRILKMGMEFPGH